MKVEKKITQATPYDIPGRPGCMKVELGEIGKRANLLADWVQKHNPQVGGYFVVNENCSAIYMPAVEFEGKYAAIASATTGAV